MEIKVKVPDEVAAQAQARGVKVEAYVEEILARQAGGQTPPPLRSAEQIRAWLDSRTILRQNSAPSREPFPRMDLSGTRLDGSRGVFGGHEHPSACHSTGRSST